MRDEFGQSYINCALGNTSRRYGGLLNGTFYTSSNATFEIGGGMDEPLTAADKAVFCSGGSGSGFENYGANEEQSVAATTGFQMTEINNVKLTNGRSNAKSRAANSEFNITYRVGEKMAPVTSSD